MRFPVHVKSLNVMLFKTSSPFILLKIRLDETSLFSYYLLDEFSSLDIKLSENRSTTEIVLSKEITRVDLSFSREFIDEVFRYSSMFEIIHANFLA